MLSISHLFWYLRVWVQWRLPLTGFELWTIVAVRDRSAVLAFSHISQDVYQQMANDMDEPTR